MILKKFIFIIRRGASWQAFPRRAWERELYSPGLILLLLLMFYVFTQNIISINNGIAWDAEVYYSMSSQFVNGETSITGIEPFIYRIGTTYIVAKLFPQNLMQGYLFYNLTIGFLTILLFYFFLRLFIN
ncbi:membrane protein, partial [Candidatus Thiomargarita nelsonii]